MKNKHSPDEEENCAICQMSVPTARMPMHMRNHKETRSSKKVPMEQQRDKLNCTICHGQLRDKYVLKDHMQNVHQYKILHCADCSFNCKRTRALKEHMEYVHKAKELTICNICGSKSRNL